MGLGTLLDDDDEEGFGKGVLIVGTIWTLVVFGAGGALIATQDALAGLF